MRSMPWSDAHSRICSSPFWPRSSGCSEAPSRYRANLSATPQDRPRCPIWMKSVILTPPPACAPNAPGSCRRPDVIGHRGLDGPCSSDPWARSLPWPVTDVTDGPIYPVTPVIRV
jgi:hypothetical protein